ncbi:site-specific DNA-methyltransferase, partial [Acinetobacter baumannii]
DGLIIHSDNFQALNLISEKYQQQIQFIYLDPPYNTDATPIIYKNGYKSSTWLTMLENRISSSINLLRKNGVFSLAIDDTELSNLSSF